MSFDIKIHTPYVKAAGFINLSLLVWLHPLPLCRAVLAESKSRASARVPFVFTVITGVHVQVT